MPSDHELLEAAYRNSQRLPKLVNTLLDFSRIEASRIEAQVVQDSLERVLSMFDENDTPIDYRFLEINPAFEKQPGLVQAVGKRMLQLAPNHEKHWFEMYGKVAMTGKPVRFENGLKHCTVGSTFMHSV